MDLVREVAVHQIDYIVRTKEFWRAHSYDEVAVVLYIAAHSHEGRGVTERSVSERLGFSRSTTNRIIKVLLGNRQIVSIPDTTPREFIYNINFADEIYGPQSGLIRNSFYVATAKNLASLCSAMIQKLALSQFDNRDN